jgi:hypothetical protein
MARGGIVKSKVIAISVFIFLAIFSFQNCKKFSVDQSELLYSTGTELPLNTESISESNLMLSIFKNQNDKNSSSNRLQSSGCQIIGNAQIPLITHFPDKDGNDEPRIFNENAEESAHQGQQNILVYNLNTVKMPAVGQYIGQRYSSSAYNSYADQNTLNQILSELCVNGLNQVKFIQSNVEIFSNGDLKKLIVEKAPYFQILHSLTFKNNLFTVIIPPYWDISSAQNLPTLFNGFYDLNENFLKLEGYPLFKTLGSVYLKKERSGFGILWNGNGAIGSRTIDDQSYTELNDFLKIFLADTGAAPNKFVSFGISRGGITALNIASHPKVTAIQVALAYSSCPPNEISEYQKYVSTTVPFLLHANDWSSGIYGSWRKSFVFPAGHGREQFEGLSGADAHFKVLTGTTDLTSIIQNNNALTSAKIQKIIQNNTQIFLEMSSHDFIVPSVDQLKLFDKALSAGVKIEGRVNYLIGHYFDIAARYEKLNFVIENLITNSVTNFIQANRLNYYITSPEGTFNLTDNNQRLASVELPRIVSKEVDTVILGFGQPQQKLMIIFKKGIAHFLLKLSMDSKGYLIQKIDAELFPEGDSEFVGAFALDSSEKPTNRLNVQFTTKNSIPTITHFKGDLQPYSHKAGSIVNSTTYGPNKSLSYFNQNVTHGSNFGFIVTGQTSISASDQEILNKVIAPQQVTKLTISCPMNLTAGDNGTCTANDVPSQSLVSGYWTVGGVQVNDSSKYSYTWNNIPAGTYKVQGVAKDAYGREVKSNILTVIVKQKTLPAATVLTISCPMNLTAGDNGTCTATDVPSQSLVSGYWTVGGVQVNDSSKYSYTWNNIPAGTYKVQGFAKDAYGREVKSNILTMTVANPTLTISCPGNIVAGSSPTCNGIARGKLTSGYWLVNDEKYSGSDDQLNFQFKNVPAGTFKVQGFAKDIFGNPIYSNILNIMVRP